MCGAHVATVPEGEGVGGQNHQTVPGEGVGGQNHQTVLGEVASLACKSKVCEKLAVFKV